MSLRSIVFGIYAYVLHIHVYCLYTLCSSPACSPPPCCGCLSTFALFCAFLVLRRFEHIEIPSNENNCDQPNSSWISDQLLSARGRCLRRRAHIQAILDLNHHHRHEKSVDCIASTYLLLSCQSRLWSVVSGCLLSKYFGLKISNTELEVVFSFVRAPEHRRIYTFYLVAFTLLRRCKYFSFFWANISLFSLISVQQCLINGITNGRERVK